MHRIFASVLVSVMLLAGYGFAADDPSCMRLDCLGRCASRAEMEGKAIQALCLQQSECYRNIDCTRLDDGKCGWRETAALKACLANKQSTMPGLPGQD